jgi:hypothetical protein
MDLLNIVNSCLSAIGNDRVENLERPDADTEMAINIAEDCHLDVLSQGWWFNTEQQWRLKPDIGTGKIRVPSGVLSFKAVGDSRFLQLSKRDGLIYDTGNHTFDMRTYAPDGVLLDLIILVKLDDCPLTAAQFIRQCARTIMLEDTNSSADKIANSQNKENKYYVLLQDEHIRNSNINVQASPMVANFMGYVGGPNSAGSFDINAVGGGDV